MNNRVPLVSPQPLSGRRLPAPEPGAARQRLSQSARPAEPAAGGGTSQPGGADERSGRGGPERGGAEPGLAGLGVHAVAGGDPAQHRVLLLVLQPLRHGDDGHAGALPVSGPHAHSTKVHWAPNLSEID